jgi:hypothetical protein
MRIGHTCLILIGLIAIILGCSRGAEFAKNYPKYLRCECEKVLVGYKFDGWFATKQACLQNANKDQTYNDTKSQSANFCDTWYRCTDEECQLRILEAPEQEDVCQCEQAKGGPNAGKWAYVCDMALIAECCCRPEV